MAGEESARAAISGPRHVWFRGGCDNRTLAGIGRLFFFEKKNQKTFAIWRAGPGERTHQIAKVFCFFSSEKKTLSSQGTVHPAGNCPAACAEAGQLVGS
jgi:hypothetical protein